MVSLPGLDGGDYTYSIKLKKKYFSWPYQKFKYRNLRTCKESGKNTIPESLPHTLPPAAQLPAITADLTALLEIAIVGYVDQILGNIFVEKIFGFTVT